MFIQNIEQYLHMLWPLRFIIGGYSYVIHKKGHERIQKTDLKLYLILTNYRYEEGLDRFNCKDRFETLEVLKNIIGYMKNSLNNIAWKNFMIWNHKIGKTFI